MFVFTSSSANKQQQQQQKKHCIQNNLIFSTCEQFLIPLKEVGMKLSISDLLEHWYGLVENEKKILSLARVSCIVTWRKTFKTSRSIKVWVTYYYWSDYYLQFHFLKLNWKECFPDWKVWKPISVALTLMFGKYFGNYGRG